MNYVEANNELFSYADPNTALDVSGEKTTVGNFRKDMDDISSPISGNIEKENHLFQLTKKNASMEFSSMEEFAETIQDDYISAATYTPDASYKKTADFRKKQRQATASSAYEYTAKDGTKTNEMLADVNQEVAEKSKALKQANKALEEAKKTSTFDRVRGVFSKDLRDANKKIDADYEQLTSARDKAQDEYDAARKKNTDIKSRNKDARKQRIISNLRARYANVSDTYDKVKAHNAELKDTFLNKIKDINGYEDLAEEWDKKAPQAPDVSKYDVSTPEGQKNYEAAKTKHEELVKKHGEGFWDNIKSKKQNFLDNASYKEYEQKAKDSLQEQIIEARRRGKDLKITDAMKEQKMQELVAKDFGISSNDAKRGITILKSMEDEKKLSSLKNLIGSRLDNYDTSEVKNAEGKVTKPKEFKALISRKAGGSGIEDAAKSGMSLKGKAAIFGGVAAAALSCVGIASLMMSGGQQSNSNLYNPYQAMY